MKFVYLLSILGLTLSSCGASNHVRTNHSIQKRKYTKGWFNNGKSVPKSGQTNVDTHLKPDALDFDTAPTTPCDTFYMKDGTIKYRRAGNKGTVFIDTYNCETAMRGRLKLDKIKSISFASGETWNQGTKEKYPTAEPCDTFYMIDGTYQLGEFIDEGPNVVAIKECENSDGIPVSIKKKEIRKIVHDNGIIEDFHTEEGEKIQRSISRAYLMIYFGIFGIGASLVVTGVLVFVIEVSLGVSIAIGILMLILAMILLIIGINKSKEKIQ